MSLLVLHPDTNGTDGAWSNVGGASKAISAQLPNNDSTNYVSEGSTNISRQSFFPTAYSGGSLPIPSTATIGAVTGSIRCRFVGGTGSGLNVTIRSYANLAGSASSDAGTVFTNSTWTNGGGAIARPGGGAWAPADFSAASFEIGCRTSAWGASVGGGFSANCTTVSLSVALTLAAPTATTNAATSVGTTTATLNGSLNPNGANAGWPVSYYFEWGPTAAYGNTTAVVGGQTGSAAIPVTAALVGLSANTTYHFRLVATNADNTTNGADQTFMTQATDRVLMYL